MTHVVNPKTRKSILDSVELDSEKLKTVKTSKKRWCYLVKLVVVVALDD